MSANATEIRRATVEVHTVDLSALLSVADCCPLLGGLNPRTVKLHQGRELPAFALDKNGGKPYGEFADLAAFKEARRVRRPAAVVVESAPERKSDPEPVAAAASRRGSGARATRSSGSHRRWPAPARSPHNPPPRRSASHQLAMRRRSYGTRAGLARAVDRDQPSCAADLPGIGAGDLASWLRRRENHVVAGPEPGAVLQPGGTRSFVQCAVEWAPEPTFPA